MSLIVNGKSITKEELVQKIEEFFNTKKVLKKTTNDVIYAPKTLESLAVFLGVCLRTLYEWEKDKDFKELISFAKQRCASDIIEHSLIGTYTPSVSMFLLKNNHGYVDKQEVVSDNIQKIEIVRTQIK